MLANQSLQRMLLRGTAELHTLGVADRVMAKFISLRSALLRVLAYPILVCACSLFPILASANDVADALAAISTTPVAVVQRLAAARFLKAECAKYLQVLPRLSPKENQWLDGEVAAGRDPETIMRSSEFARRALLNHFARCVDGATAVLNADRSDVEILGWATLISAFDDYDVEIQMQRSGSPQLEKDAGRAAALHLFAEPILDNIVLPHLRERATSPVGGNN